MRLPLRYAIRPMGQTEYQLLNDFLYEAIFIPDGVKAPPREILHAPELQVYVSGFGSQERDRALVAEVDGRIIGAVWVRVMEDYGHIDNETPSLAISLYPAYRALGIGSAMMKEMLSVLADSGIRQVSLSVQKDNYAVRMYQKLGFVVHHEKETEYIMVCRLALESP